LGDLLAIGEQNLWGGVEVDPKIPAWVWAVSKRLDATLFAPITSTLDELKLTSHRAGFAMGLLRWSGEAMTPTKELQVLARKLKISTRARRRIGSLYTSFLLKNGFVTKAELAKSEFIPKKAFRLEEKLRRGPLSELKEFHRGFAEGLSGVGKDSPGDRSDTSTELLFILAMWWRLVVRFKSISQLHVWITHLMGPRAGEKKRLEKICQRIGLRLSKRGRPRKIQTPALPG